jgi:hypothetical protein
MHFFKPVLTFGTLFLLLFGGVSGCSSQQETSNQENEESVKAMTEKDYKAATVLDYSEEGDCGFLLQVEGDTKLLKPLKLEKQFQKHNKTVWITFGYSRRHQGNCLIGVPINLGDIQERNSN